MDTSGTAFHFSSASCSWFSWMAACDWASSVATRRARASTIGKGAKATASTCTWPASGGGEPSGRPIARASRTLAWASFSSVIWRANSMSLADISVSTTLRYGTAAAWNRSFWIATTRPATS